MNGDTFPADRLHRPRAVYLGVEAKGVVDNEFGDCAFALENAEILTIAFPTQWSRRAP